LDDLVVKLSTLKVEEGDKVHWWRLTEPFCTILQIDREQCISVLLDMGFKSGSHSLQISETLFATSIALFVLNSVEHWAKDSQKREQVRLLANGARNYLFNMYLNYPDLTPQLGSFTPNSKDCWLAFIFYLLEKNLLILGFPLSL